MPKLSDTQLVMLNKAAQRNDHGIVLPDHLPAGARLTVANSLLKKGLVAEVPKTGDLSAWRERDGRWHALIITDAGLHALGIEPEEPQTDEAAHAAPQAADTAAPAEPAEPAGDTLADTEAAPEANTAGTAPQQADAGHTAAAPVPRRSREGTKQAQLIDMLKRPEGATVEEIASTMQWQPHTVRGAIAGALKKKLGLTVTSETVEGRGRVYRIAA
jgi:hypothetical protein